MDMPMDVYRGLNILKQIVPPLVWEQTKLSLVHFQDTTQGWLPCQIHAGSMMAALVSFDPPGTEWVTVGKESILRMGAWLHPQSSSNTQFTAAHL